MPKEPLFSVATLRQLIDYNPETGSLTWRERGSSFFVRERDRKTWNKRFSGKPALAATNGSGYLHGTLNGKNAQAHRVAFALLHERWPQHHIDHINGDRSDNRACNLREVSHQGNMRNAARPSHNSSGVTGVHWHKSREKWCAQITVNQRCRHLGLFQNLSDAINARKAAEAQHQFHPNHGRP